MRLFVTAITFVGIFSLPHWAIITMNALVYGRLDLSKHCELFNERGHVHQRYSSFSESNHLCHVVRSHFRFLIEYRM